MTTSPDDTNPDAGDLMEEPLRNGSLEGSVMEWLSMDTAPRDGTIVDLRADDEPGPHRMYWAPGEVNPLVSLKPGIWVAEHGGYTWSEDRGFGPEQWRPVPIVRLRATG